MDCITQQAKLKVNVTMCDMVYPQVSNAKIEADVLARYAKLANKSEPLII